MATGIVQFYNDVRGLGFIQEYAAKKDIIVQSSGIIDDIQAGDEVSFEINNEAGRLVAIKVKKEKAKTHYLKYLELNPEDFEVRLDFAYLLKHHFRDYDEARKQYSNLLEIDPGNSKAHYNLANLLKSHDGDYQSAKKHYLAALKYDDLNYKTNNNLANIFHEQFKEHESAERHYRRALDGNPGKDLRDYKENQAVYFTETGVNPDKSQVHFNLAILLIEGLQELEEAKHQCQLALESNMHNFDAHYCLGNLLVNHFEDAKGAEEHYAQARKLNSNLESIKSVFSVKDFGDQKT